MAENKITWFNSYITFVGGWFIYVDKDGASPISYERARQFEIDRARYAYANGVMHGAYMEPFVPPKKFETDILFNISRYKEQKGDLIIPPSVGSYKFTQIVNNAFGKNKSITSIKLPSDIKRICYDAFCGLSNLKKVDFSGSNPIIDASAFVGTPYYENMKHGDFVIVDKALLKANSSISGEVVIPKDVVSISDRAFQNCKFITRVVVHKDVKYIGYWAFSKCESLEEFIYPDDFNFSNVMSNAFEYCSSLKSIKIPEGTDSRIKGG